MKIIRKNKYDIAMKLHGDAEETVFRGMYYMGMVQRVDGDGLCCACCGKTNMNFLNQFRLPKGNACFDECQIACYSDELYIGSSCMGKAKFKISEN